MGNGPSLRNTDWDLLSNEYVFGMNRIYLLIQEMGFIPDFYVCVKDLVFEQFAHEIQPLKSLKFCDWSSAHRHLDSDANTVFIPHIVSEGFRFRANILTGWNRGCTVTYTALQVAFFMGFDEVILIGVDHFFCHTGKPKLQEVSQGDDPNHFAPDYFGKGIKWEYPNLSGSEIAYDCARNAFENAGRRIVDATQGGHLTVFPKTSLGEALATSQLRGKEHDNTAVAPVAQNIP